MVRGDATAAYGPELGLKRFVREFVYRTNAGFTVTDEVETTKPAILTWLLHADNTIEKISDRRFKIEVGTMKLLIDPTIEGPDLKQFRIAIEPNTLTAPGPPGAVDKGERQERGQKLLLSTFAPTTRARFVQRLEIQN